MWIAQESDIVEAVKEMERRLEEAQDKARERTLGPHHLLPKLPGEYGWKASLEERIVALPPWGFHVDDGGGVAKAYLNQWRAYTTAAAAAWVRFPGGFPIALGLRVDREPLSYNGLARWRKDYLLGEAVREVRRELKERGMEEPTEEVPLGGFRLRRRILSSGWEEILAGEARLGLPGAISLDPHHTPETNARKLVRAFGWPRKQTLRLLTGEADEAEAEALLVLTGLR